MSKKATENETRSGTDKVTVYDLMDLLGVCYNTAAEKMGNYKRALQAIGRDISNMQGAITIGDYCYITGITVPDLIAWREYQACRQAAMSAQALGATKAVAQ